MISYQFISDLFTSILQRSATIEGRFFVSDKSGTEINSDILGQMLTDATTQIIGEQKYPLALMLPPVTTGEMNGASEWQDYMITIFFLRTSYYDGFNQVEDLNENTQTSMRPVIKDWEEMGTVASDFAKSLDITMRTDDTSTYFRVKGGTKRITPVSKVGVDRASGVQLNLMISLFAGCDLSDIDIASVIGAMPPKAAETDPVYEADKPMIVTNTTIEW